MAQKINVIVENPDPEYFSKVMSRVIAEIIRRRIDKLPYDQQDQAYSLLIDELKEDMEQ